MWVVARPCALAGLVDCGRIVFIVCVIVNFVTFVQLSKVVLKGNKLSKRSHCRVFLI